jgi:hypothetical protein
MAGAVLVRTFSVQPWTDAGNLEEPREGGAPPHWQPIPLRSIDCQCGASLPRVDFYRRTFTPPIAAAFEEQGGTFPVAFDKINNDRLLSKVGLRVGRHGPLSNGIDLGVDGAAYWVHDYTSREKAIPYRVGTSGSTVAGRSLVTDSAMFDLGVQATFGGKLTLGGSGRQQVGGEQYQTTGLFSVGVRF